MRVGVCVFANFVSAVILLIHGSTSVTVYAFSWCVGAKVFVVQEKREEGRGMRE